MSADFKSHVLRRDEKGLFGVPFKRWLLAGCGGGLVYTVTNMMATSWAIPIAGITAVSLLVFTGSRGGIPRWQRWWYHLRGMLLLGAARQADGWQSWLATTLELPVGLVQLEGAQVFAPPQSAVEIDLREWITFAHAAETDGLVFVDAPLGEVARGD